MSNGTNLDAATEHKKHDAPAHHVPHHATASADPIEAHWKVLAHQMREKWPSITEDDVKFVDKTKFALLSKVKERTGLESETAERQLDALITGLGA